MVISCLAAFALPIVLLVYFRTRKGADVLPFFIGCAVMLLFALILERAINNAVLSSSLGAAIQGNTWLYALFGGIMAGLFEETGRFIAFKTVLRNRQGNDANALMYGAGHGGFEAVVVLGISMVVNIAFSLTINSGGVEALTGSLPADQVIYFETAIKGLFTAPSYQFLLGGVERIFAVVLHIALSVLVWFAAKTPGKGHLYPLAILIHLAVDAAAVLLARFGVQALLVEAAVGILAALTAVYARRVWIANATLPPEHTD